MTTQSYVHVHHRCHFFLCHLVVTYVLPGIALGYLAVLPLRPGSVLGTVSRIGSLLLAVQLGLLCSLALLLRVPFLVGRFGGALFAHLWEWDGVSMGAKSVLVFVCGEGYPF